MSQPEQPPIVLADEMDERFAELQRITARRMLDAGKVFNMGPDGTEAAAAGAVRRQVDYTLEEGRTSRFVAVRADSHGFQASMLAFESKDFPGSVPPIPEVVRQSELALAGKLGSLTCVDFFSIRMGASPLHLVGVETMAGDERIEDLLRTLQHPDLQELAGRVQTVRYAPAAVVLVEASAQARSWADRCFVSRKLPEVIELAPEGTDARRELEIAAASLRERMLGSQE